MERLIGRVTDRRRLGRCRTASEHGILVARVRPGHHASIIDISAQGALIETAHRLLPGAPLELQLETARDRTAMRGRVVRCSVAGVLASAVWYHGAIHFDRSLSWFIDVKRTEYPVLLSAEVLSLQP